MYVRGKASHSRQHDYCLQIYGDFTSKGIKEIQKKIKKPPTSPNPLKGTQAHARRLVRGCFPICQQKFSKTSAEVFPIVSINGKTSPHERENICWEKQIQVPAS